MNREEIIKIKELKLKGFTCKEIQKEMSEYSFDQIKHVFTKLKHDSKENITKIKTLCDEYSYSEIDKKINLPKGTSKLLCQLYDIKIYKTKSLSYSKKEIEMMNKYYPQCGRKYMANILNTSEERIRIMASKLGLKRNYQYSDKEEKNITKDFKNGMTPKDLSLKYNRSIHAIESFLSRRNLNNIHNVNSPYYISKPEKYMINYITSKLNITVPDKEDINNRDYYYKVVGNYEIDLPLYINGYKFAIEYDSEYWHKNLERDDIKTNALKKAGFIVFRISSKDHNNNFYNLNSLNKKLDEIVNAIKLITGSH